MSYHWRNQEEKETRWLFLGSHMAPVHKEKDVLTSEGGTGGLSDLRSAA